MTDLAINIEKLCKSFAGVQVLGNINLSVAAGEFMGLIGVNGAGKTTLIKCLLDFCDITSGNIRIFGNNHINSQSRKDLVFLPELFVPPYYLTGENFLAYMAELHGVEYQRDKVRSLAEILDMDIAILSKSVSAFSKGTAQKLGLLACLMSNKSLMVFDEPMTGLDPRARAYFKEYLVDLKQQGKTVFFSTHLLADIEILCDHIAILHGGNIRFNGTVEECTSLFESDNLEQAYLACVSV